MCVPQVVEQYNWSGDWGPDHDEDHDDGVSAAASGEAGPPPMAVALVSSLFSTETTQQRTASNLRPAGAAAAHVPVGLPSGTYQHLRSGGGGNGVPGGMPPSPRLPPRGGGSDTDSQQGRSSPNLDSLELEMEQRLRLLAWAQNQAELDAGGGGAGGGGRTSSPGPSRPIPDFIRLPGEEGEEGQVAAEEEEEGEEYAGQWHKPPRFQDGFDADKEWVEAGPPWEGGGALSAFFFSLACDYYRYGPQLKPFVVFP